MSRAQSAMRAGLQLLSSFSRSLWMSQPLSLSRAARRKTAAVVLPCRKPPVSVTSPQGQGFAQRALRPQTGRQAT